MSGAKKRGLGRGLDALLANRASFEAPAKTAGEREARTLPVEALRRGRYQPREAIDDEALAELADSIRAQGILQAIIVRPVGGGYEIVAGERRWRAAQLAGLHEVPVVVRDLDDQAAMAMGLIENIQREDLNPMEEARALLRLTEEFGLTHQQIAESVGRSRSAVSNLLRLCDLHHEVAELLSQGRIEMGHARALLALPSDEQPGLAREVVRRGLSVRETEHRVRRLRAGAPPAGRETAAVDADIRQLQEDLAERLGARVSFRHQASGKGRLIIQYDDLDQLEGILARIG